MVTLAHLSDLHLTAPSFPRGSEFSPKRLLGYVSWRLRRRRHHPTEPLEALLDDAPFQAADHVIVTGDLTFLGLGEEVAQARVWLHRLGAPARLTALPGNHDVYADGSERAVLREWGALLGAPTHSRAPFPRRQDVGPVTLFLVSTASPSRLLEATGRIGRSQLERLEQALRSCPPGRFRVVALHHPPRDGVVANPRRLIDAEALRQVVSGAGCELVIHGHAHRTALGFLVAGGRSIPCIGARSATEVRPSEKRIAEYHLYEIREDRRAWQITLVRRRWDPARRCWRDADRSTWEVAAAGGSGASPSKASVAATSPPRTTTALTGAH